MMHFPLPYNDKQQPPSGWLIMGGHHKMQGKPPLGKVVALYYEFYNIRDSIEIYKVAVTDAVTFG